MSIELRVCAEARLFFEKTARYCGSNGCQRRKGSHMYMDRHKDVHLIFL